MFTYQAEAMETALRDMGEQTFLYQPRYAADMLFLLEKLNMLIRVV